MADTKIPDVTGEEVRPSRSDAEMREMIRVLLDKVDSLEQQIAAQGERVDTSAPETEPGGFERMGEEGFIDDGSPVTQTRRAESFHGGNRHPDSGSDPTTFPAEEPVAMPAPDDRPSAGPPAPQFPYQQGPVSSFLDDGWTTDGYQEQVARFHHDAEPPFGGAYGGGPYVQPAPAPSQSPGFRDGLPDDALYQGSPQGMAPSHPGQVPPQVGRLQWHRLSEGNIGRYGTGLMASVLVIMGVWVGAQLVWNQIPALMRMLALLCMGVLTEGVAAALVTRSDDGRRNGFLTSLSATGAIVSFLSLAIGGMLYGLYGPPLMGILFLAWFFGQTMVARLVRSRLFYAVTYVGGAVTMILEATQVISSANLMTCLAFSLTALVIPLVGLVDRHRNPAVPYASSVFSMASAYASVMLVGIAWGDRSTLASTPEFTTMASWLAQNLDMAILAVTGFVSGCAVVAGTRGLPALDDVSHVAVKTAFGTVGLILMMQSATCLPWDCGVVPNATFCLAALSIMLATKSRELRIPTAILTAFSMWHLLDGTEDAFMELLGTPVSGALPALMASCVVSLVPAARGSRSRIAATLTFVAMSCLPVVSGDWSSHGLSYAVPVTAFAVFACVTTFRLAMEWLGMREDEMTEGIGRQMITDPRAQGMWVATRRRVETARRLVPLGMALLASLSLMPVIRASGSPVATDVAPALFALLVSLHMMAGIGFGSGWGLPGTEHEVRQWRGVQGQYSEGGDMTVARTVRGWNLAMLFVAYAWAVVAHGLGSDGVEGAIGNAAYSLSLIVIPSTLIAHATSRRSLWSVIASTFLSHLSFGIVAGLWVSGNVGLVASCLSIALALGFVGIGFKAHKGDIRMTGLVTMILFVMKIALIDLPRASTTGLNVLLLIGTGVLCFAISFAYNRLDRVYGDDEDALFEDVAEEEPAFAGPANARTEDVTVPRPETTGDWHGELNG